MWAGGGLVSRKVFEKETVLGGGRGVETRGWEVVPPIERWSRQYRALEWARRRGAGEGSVLVHRGVVETEIEI